ncbi:phosphate/phosphite/phosphonate ABC transporter substrate-binding protein [Natrarchaeobius chitinivorans]|uniref:Phosphate/phosphite/phosphonate ABC transporter substrate-binding protein n=1 Tax=Natrarchaeobius chitinivorans TaxID=1679083 RepID=A0A3N6P5Q7_NATCH|nr:phosphate/phosphite/phosphonate ABC transporter substrate-binding protein [Natrarchaeobius chitinivorans]RQG93519.1 phosphate/phosphite/phosphonate ABC transporter substrate-binding protein [Natrarchaeobius chitinivorans]
MVKSNTINRRAYLAGIASTGAVGVAGCTGGENGNGNGNGNGDTDDSADSGNGVAPYEDFDPDNPRETLPALAPTLYENNLHEGTEAALEEAMERDLDEPRHGDPVWDEPDDEDEIVDPDVIQLAYGSGEEADGIYQDLFYPLEENIEEETGREVEFNVMEDYSATIEAFRSDRVHVSNFATGTVPLAVNVGGAVPIGMPVNEGRYGYRLWLITRRDNDDINSLEDLEGKTVAHSSDGSFSGHQAPSVLFEDEAGINPEEDYNMVFSGGHNEGQLGVYHGDYDAAPIAAGSMQRVEDEIDFDEIKIVYMSEPFPFAPLCYMHNLHPDVKEGIERAVLDYDYAGTSIEEAIDNTEWLEIDYAPVWDVVLQVQQGLGMEYHS